MFSHAQGSSIIEYVESCLNTASVDIMAVFSLLVLVCLFFCDFHFFMILLYKLGVFLEGLFPQNLKKENELRVSNFGSLSKRFGPLRFMGIFNFLISYAHSLDPKTGEEMIRKTVHLEKGMLHLH